ncbi:MAG: hypothetical protein V1820_00800, partial [archaeon]
MKAGKGKVVGRFVYLLPRILAVAFALFIELFAFDSESPLGFLMHSLPSVIVLAVAFLSWKRSSFGAWGFLLLGTAFTLFFRTWKSPFSLLLISGPLFLTSVLYFSETRGSNKGRR